jgi:hypothetical protein
MGKRSPIRVTLEMGLVGVIATQLWHQTFIDGNLADLPTSAPSQWALTHGVDRNGKAPAAKGKYVER